MNLWFCNFCDLDFEELVEVCQEDILTHGRLHYPNESTTEQLRLAEVDFADYLRNVFFRQKGSAYCILVNEGKYISAARLEPYEDGYLLTALITRVDYRRMGYGRQLLLDLMTDCVANGRLPIYSHIANRNVVSYSLHLQCGFRVLKDTATYLDGSVHTDSKTFIYTK